MEITTNSSPQVTSSNLSLASFNFEEIHAQFPLLQHQNNRNLIYLDSAATAQKPDVVIDTMTTYYQTYNANVHRGVYDIAEQATQAIENTRSAIKTFLGAKSEKEIIFTKNASEALNLVAYSWGRTNLHEGDVVLLSQMEHHSNIVPWQILAQERSIQIRWIPVTPDGYLDLTDIDELLQGVKLVGITAMSNVLGTLPPLDLIISLAHKQGAIVLVDGCQSVPHSYVDVQKLNADFLAFSGHKICGPTGIGVLWGREELLEKMPPFLGGGEMIRDVTLNGFTCNELPWKFEAGTPPIAEIIGLGAAITYVSNIGMDVIRTYEKSLLRYALDAFAENFGTDLIVHGPKNVEDKGGILSFAFKDLHPHDISQLLNEHQVCVRAGHHCAKPLMKTLGINATARASIYFYNSTDDIDALCSALHKTATFFGV